MATLTLLSNGHGEDAVGALLAAALLELRPDLRIAAFPVVDEGAAYAPLGLPLLGPRRRMPSGGLLLHHPRLLLADLRAGFLPMTLAQARDLARLETDLLLVVGDVYALALSALVRTRARFFVQTLVSARHRPVALGRPGRVFMERLTPLERALMRRWATWVYLRDAPTAELLRARGLRRVSALGNPMLDALGGEPLASGPDLRVALLPGSRAYAAASLERMLAALARLPEASGYVAWAGGALPRVAGWTLEEAEAADGLRARYRRGSQTAFVYQGRFADVLHTAQLVLGTAGTAHEQAAALGRPVVAFALPPYYRSAFLHNQKRLLGPALTLAPDEPEALAATLRALWRDPARYAEAAATGLERMGPPGGSRAIAADLLARAGL